MLIFSMFLDNSELQKHFLENYILFTKLSLKNPVYEL